MSSRVQSFEKNKNNLLTLNKRFRLTMTHSSLHRYKVNVYQMQRCKKKNLPSLNERFTPMMPGSSSGHIN